MTTQEKQQLAELLEKAIKASTNQGQSDVFNNALNYTKSIKVNE